MLTNIQNLCLSQISILQQKQCLYKGTTRKYIIMKCIVIAVFVKEDLIQKQIDNLLSLEKLDEYNIIFCQDNIMNSPKYDSKKYRVKMENVKNIIENNLHKFQNAVFHRANTNLHPYGICKYALDSAFANNEFCIFMEDDVFLARNALSWFNYVYTNTLLSWDTYKFATGESIYYDTHTMEITPTQEQIQTIRQKIKENMYHTYYYEINNFLTSSIFATTKEIWNTEISDIRGSMNGECALNDYIQKNNWKSIFPVVPFAKDIGMLHDDGWSVMWHTKTGVSEIKNVYLMADEFEISGHFELLPEPRDQSILYPTLETNNF